MPMSYGSCDPSLPLGLWVDDMEEAGEDVSSLRAWIEAGEFVPTYGYLKGYGDGDGYGYGDGYGHGYGYGYGDGYGHGYGDGYGYGHGHGHGYGNGDGYGYGNG